MKTNHHKQLGNIDECIEGLRKAYDLLPKVDEEGNSECPFAEQLYAQKQEQQRELQQHLEKLKKDLVQVETDIQKCNSNANIVASDQGQLHSQNVFERYEQAEDKLKSKLKQLHEKRTHIRSKMKDTEKLLAKTNEKNWPDGEPEGQRFSLGPSLSLLDNSTSPDNRQLDTGQQLNGLFEIDRMRY